MCCVTCLRISSELVMHLYAITLLLVLCRCSWKRKRWILVKSWTVKPWLVPQTSNNFSSWDVSHCDERESLRQQVENYTGQLTSYHHIRLVLVLATTKLSSRVHDEFSVLLFSYLNELFFNICARDIKNDNHKVDFEVYWSFVPWLSNDCIATLYGHLDGVRFIKIHMKISPLGTFQDLFSGHYSSVEHKQ